MITFEWPWALATIPLPFAARYLLSPARAAAGQALRLPFLQSPSGLEGGSSSARGRWRRVLAWLAWTLLVLAAARPQWLGDPVNLPVSGRDLMLAVDVSGSMEQPDYRLEDRSVSRLEVVKTVAGHFIERREGDRLGLILFGSRAYLQTPLTYDRVTVQTMLSEAVIGLAGRETAVGDAIALAVKRLRDQPEDNRVLILLTDGTNTAGNLAPLDAAGLAASVGVRIYTIGIGGGRVGLRSPFGMLMQRPGDLDPETLRIVAEETGGRFFEATDTDELESVYDELDRLEPSVRDTRTYRPMQALYIWPAGAALLLSVWVALMGFFGSPTPSPSPAKSPRRSPFDIPGQRVGSLEAEPSQEGKPAVGRHAG